MVLARLFLAFLLLGAAAWPALAGGKSGGKDGAETAAAAWAALSGPREMVFAPAQASASLGQVTVAATMWAGSGAAKCRLNFFIENFSSSAVALGFVARTFNAKDEIVDAWVVNVAELQPSASTGRLFSCTLGATQFTLVPMSGYDWPPAKCAKPGGETDMCPLTFKLTSTVPIVLNKEEKKPEEKKDDKPAKKGGH